MSKLFLLLVLADFPQSGRLGPAVAENNPGLIEAANAARKAGLRDVLTYPKQSFPVSWKGVRLGTFLSLGGRSAGSSYQCLQSFVPADEAVAPSSLVVAGAGRLGAEICDHPGRLEFFRRLRIELGSGFCMQILSIWR